MNEIIIPKSLESYQQEIMLQKVIEKNKEVQKEKELKLNLEKEKMFFDKLKSLGSKLVHYNELRSKGYTGEQYSVDEENQFRQEYKEYEDKIRQDINERNSIQLSSDDAIQITNEVNDCLCQINDGVHENIYQLKIFNPSKDKIISRVSDEEIPMLLRNIISVVKELSSNSISSRMLDVKQIAKIDHELRKGNCENSLSALTISFKPIKNDSKKSNRVMLSITNDYIDNGDVLLFMQNERNRFCDYIRHGNFSSTTDYILFIATIINDFFIVGYDSILNRVLGESRGASFIDKLKNIIASQGLFIVETNISEDVLMSVRLIKNIDKYVVSANIVRGDFDKTYSVAITKLDPSMGCGDNYTLVRNVTIDYLLRNFMNMLKGIFLKKKEDVPNEDYQSILDKFVTVKMREAFNMICNYMINAPQCVIEINRGYSRSQSSEFLGSNIKAEILIGKSLYLEYFILTCFRDKSGEIKLLLEYSFNNNDCSCIGSSLSEILSRTSFLTENPIIVKD